MKKLLRKITSIFSGTPAAQAPPKQESTKSWKDVEYFEDSWINRVKTMAELLPENAEVMDLGCGKMGLPRVKKMRRYIPVDYTSRSADTIVCDFNKGQFPTQNSEYCFVSGCLEYVNDPQWFVSEIATHCEHCVISYCSTDGFADIPSRKQLYWVNHLSREKIIELFSACGMKLIRESFYVPHNNIFLFTRTKND